MPRSMVGVTALLFASAGAGVVQQCNNGPSVVLEHSECFDLMAGQNYYAGTVCTTLIDDDGVPTLEVVYKTTGNWVLKETHLWIGETKESYPQGGDASGNPAPGRFPYTDVFGTDTTEHTVEHPLDDDDICKYCMGDTPRVFIMAHAKLCENGENGLGEETGWAGPDGGVCERPVDKGSWATRCEVNFGYTCCTNGDCSSPGNGGVSETAFAYDAVNAKCFYEIDDKLNSKGKAVVFKRWGWTNGPYDLSTAPTVVTLEIWAGAGMCQLDKGTKVGTLTGTLTAGPTGNMFTVTYLITKDYWEFTEFHLYVGVKNLPTKKSADDEWTVAPGQYPVEHYPEVGDKNEWAIVVPLDPPAEAVYIVAHAVVEFKPPSPPPSPPPPPPPSPPLTPP